MDQQFSPDSRGIVIVGGGLAGLFCALKLVPHPVTLLTSGSLGDGASAWAQGGIAAAIGEGDTADAHAADTIAAGAGIVDPRIARLIADEAGERVLDLLGYGVPFDRDLEGRLNLSREAAHNARRIVRVSGDRAGAAIMAALVTAVRAAPSIRVVENVLLESLIMAGGRVSGVRGVQGGRGISCHASRVVLATGGVGQLYRVTTNPLSARGDGLAAAADAGALLADTEFVQFHPTGVDVGRDPAPLATEALRGDGAVLVNRDGQRFMPAIHPDAELAPRDVVARAVFAEVMSGRGAFLDARSAIGARFPDLFPTVAAACREAGIDLVRDPIPVAPAAHYHMGGVLTEENGRTSLPGLWACGEVACTGAHGANRLASNSLLEAVVFAARIAADLASVAPSGFPALLPDERPVGIAADPARIAELREMMAANVGVLRNGHGLMDAMAYLRGLDRDGAAPAELARMARVGLLIASAAWQRRESRGGHYRLDHPESSARLAKRSVLTLADARRIADEAMRIAAGAAA